MKSFSGWKGWAALLFTVCALAAAAGWGATAWKNAQQRKAVETSFQTTLARSLPQADALRSELVQQKLLLENLLAQGEAATKSQGIPTDLLQTASARFRELLDRASILADQIQAEADQAAARLGLASSDSLFPSSNAPSWRTFLTEINQDRQWGDAARQRIALLEERSTMLAAQEQAPAAQQPGFSPEDFSVPPPDVPATNPPPEGYGIDAGSSGPFVGDTEATTSYGGGGYGGYPYWGWGMGMWGMGMWGMGFWPFFFPFFPMVIVEQQRAAHQQQHQGKTAANHQAATQSRVPSHSSPAPHHGLTQHGAGHGTPANGTTHAGGIAHGQDSSHTGAHAGHGASALAHGGFPSQSAVHPQHLFSPAVHDVAGRSVNSAALHGANLGTAAHAHGFHGGSAAGAGSFAGHTGFPHGAAGGFHGATGLGHGGALGHAGVFHGTTGLGHGGVFHGVGGSFHGSPNVFHGASLGAGGPHGLGGFHGMPGGLHGGMGGFHGGMGGFHGGMGGFHGGFGGFHGGGGGHR